MLLSAMLSFSSLLTIATSLNVPRVSDHGTPGSLEPIILHQFPNSWNENLRIRKQNQLLITQITTPTVYLLNINSPSAATLIHNFSPFSGVLGITEVARDHFYVIAGKFTLSPLNLGIGSYTIWSIDMTTYSSKSNATVAQVASLPESGLLDGLATLDAKRGLIIAADSTFGIVWLINVYTGNVTKLLQEPEMAPVAGPGFSIGINGVHAIRTSTHTADIYFSNTALETFYRVPISMSTLQKTGPVEPVVTGIAIDDFALDAEENVAYVAAGSLSSVVKVDLCGNGKMETVLGGVNSTLVAPTSVVLGGKGKIYVTTQKGLVAEGNVECQ